jgi:hypothetical protein
MNHGETINALEKLKAVSNNDQYIEVKKYSLETLENMAIGLYDDAIHKKHPFDLLSTILRERVVRINQNFKWSNENIQKLLKVDNNFIETFENAYREALLAAGELERRIENRDPFIKDYEIEIKITSYSAWQSSNHDDICIDDVLSAQLYDCCPIQHHISHDFCNSETRELPVYLDKSKNWNIEYFGEVFKNNYISFAIHTLLISHIWSFQDIININRIWANVKVERQYFVENI